MQHQIDRLTVLIYGVFQDWKHMPKIPFKHELSISIAKEVVKSWNEWLLVDEDECPDTDYTYVFETMAGDVMFGTVKSYGQVWYFREKNGYDYPPSDIKRYCLHVLPIPPAD